MGICQPEDFSNLCFNDKWMVWIYIMEDMKSSYCLYSPPPSYVGMESGFPTTDKATTQKRNRKAVENDPEKFE